jgi:hypothetical protein
MKDLARHMRRVGVSPKRRKKKERGEASNRFPPLVTPQIEAEAPAASTQPEGLPEIPDAWDTKHRPEVEKAAAEARKELASHGETRAR